MPGEQVLFHTERGEHTSDTRPDYLQPLFEGAKLRGGFPRSSPRDGASRAAVGIPRDLAAGTRQDYRDRMGTLRYSINVTIDGCVDHREGYVDAESHAHAEQTVARADALLLGRVTYQMMEDAWRPPASDTMPEWAKPFGRTIDAAKKYVVSSTLRSVDWNAELVSGDLADAVRDLKAHRDVYVGGVTLPTALAALDLIDEYEFVVHPRIAGHGPRLFDGLTTPIDLVATGRKDLRSGLVVTSYVPRSRT